MGKIIMTADGIAYWDEPNQETLAIMSEVCWGIIDSDHYPNEPTVGMTVETMRGHARLRLTSEQSHKLAVVSGVDDITELNGKPCVVVNEDEYCRFIRYHRS